MGGQRQRQWESANGRRARGRGSGLSGRLARIKALGAAEWMTIVSIVLMLLVVIYVILHTLGNGHSSSGLVHYHA
jgi:hypothetical protein